MRIIGLTGSIGCGKSHVSSVLSSLGACIIDGDRISRSLTAPGGQALPGIRRLFGDKVFQRDILDRRALGSLVFSSASAREQLNSLMQPLIYQEIQRQLADAGARSCPVAVLDMPLLFEAGLDSLCDTVWCVYLPEDLQIRRIMERDGMSETDARNRIASQMPAEEKKRRSQVIIDTSGTLEETAELIPPLYRKELDAAGVRRRRRSGQSRQEDAPEAPLQPPVSAPAPVMAGYPGHPGNTAANQAPVPRPRYPEPVSPPAPVKSAVPKFPDASGFHAQGYNTSGYNTPGYAPGNTPGYAGTPMNGAASPINESGENRRRRSAPRQPSEDTPIQRGESHRSVFDPDRPAAPQSRPVSRVLLVFLLVFFLTAGGTLVASRLMQGYLRQQEQARADAYQAVVDAHPLGYANLIRSYAEEYGLHSAYVSAIILNESNYDPRAVSSVGARGLMQVMPDTAQWISEKLRDSSYSFEKMFDPETNIRYGCWYLNYLSGLFLGDPAAVTSAYHAGQGTVRGWLSDGVSSTDGGRTLNLDTMPDGPTKTYAKRVIRDYAIYDALYDHVFNPVPDPDAPAGGSQ